MYILNYYRESEKRSKKREQILRKCQKYFSYNSHSDASMTEIAKYLELERRTLYYYYNNKEDLVLDVYLYFSENFCRKDIEGSSKYFDDSDKSYKTKLKEYFKNYVNIYAQEQEKSVSVIDIDNFVYNLEEDSEIFTRYIDIIANIRRDYDRIVKVFEQAVEAGEIDIKYSEARSTYFMVEQVLRTYIIKRWAMRSFNDVYPLENLNKIINILIDGL